MNMSKPLMSRLLVANNSKAIPIRGVVIPTRPLDARGATLEDYGHVGGQIFTPKKAIELRSILHPNNNYTPVERLLFRKVIKAFDQKDTQLAL